MYRVIRAATDESVYDDCFEEAGAAVIDYIEEGSAWNYDDVVSETYAQIQDYFDRIHSKLTDEVEDKIYEDIMESLDDKGYIDHQQGLLLFEYEDEDE